MFNTIDMTKRGSFAETYLNSIFGYKMPSDNFTAGKRTELNSRMVNLGRDQYREMSKRDIEFIENGLK
jgi:hypothetical protein